MAISSVCETSLYITTAADDECGCSDNFTIIDEEEVFACEKCGELFDEDDIELFDDQRICESCLDTHTVVCKDCDDRIWREDAYSVNSDFVCEHCYDRHYTTCSSCDRVIPYDDVYHIDDEDDDDYCERCYNEKKREYIQSYYYKPCPIFYADDGTSHASYPGNGIFYGVELEIDDGGESDENAGILHRLANSENEKLYIKHDSSLSEGLELVSHPMTLNYHATYMPWRDVLTRALRMGYKSHDTSTCGLHIHIGREGLSKDHNKQEEVIGRILYFVERHWDKLLVFSRRTEDSLNRWAARYGLRGDVKETLKNAKDQNIGRYVCLNLQNNETIEWRILRGTLRYDTFLAALQLVDEITVTAIKLEDDDFQGMTWDVFVSKIDESKKPELIKYLKHKDICTESGGC